MSSYILREESYSLKWHHGGWGKSWAEKVVLKNEENNQLPVIECRESGVCALNGQLFGSPIPASAVKEPTSTRGTGTYQVMENEFEDEELEQIRCVLFLSINSVEMQTDFLAEMHSRYEDFTTIGWPQDSNLMFPPLPSYL